MPIQEIWFNPVFVKRPPKGRSSDITIREASRERWKTFKYFQIAAQIQKKKLFHFIVPSARGKKAIPLSV